MLHVAALAPDLGRTGKGSLETLSFGPDGPVARQRHGRTVADRVRMQHDLAGRPELTFLDLTRGPRRTTLTG